jgi:hypothetical protein
MAPINGCAMSPEMGPASQTRDVSCSDRPRERRKGVPYPSSLRCVSQGMLRRGRSYTVHAIFSQSQRCFDVGAIPDSPDSHPSIWSTPSSSTDSSCSVSPSPVGSLDLLIDSDSRLAIHLRHRRWRDAIRNEPGQEGPAARANSSWVWTPLPSGVVRRERCIDASRGYCPRRGAVPLLPWCSYTLSTLR